MTEDEALQKRKISTIAMSIGLAGAGVTLATGKSILFAAFSAIGVCLLLIKPKKGISTAEWIKKLDLNVKRMEQAWMSGYEFHQFERTSAYPYFGTREQAMKESILDIIGDEKTPIRSIRFDNDSMWISLKDGRRLSIPLDWFPRLRKATPDQRDKWRLCRKGIHWDELGEDISIKGLMEGRKSMEAAFWEKAFTEMGKDPEYAKESASMEGTLSDGLEEE